MEKQKITVTVAGKNYTLVSGDSPEFVCFNLAEDLLKAQDENTLLRRQMEQLARTSKAIKE